MAAYNALMKRIVICASGFMLYGVSPALEAQGGGTGREMETQAQRIQKWSLVAHKGDEPSIRALADEIFNYQLNFPRMPTTVEALVKERFVQAEIAFLRGNGPGVQEQSVVRLINFLAHRLNTPEYTRMGLNQLRYLRMGLVRRVPLFMGLGITTSPAMKTGDSINTTMSPLQAAYLTLMLIDQKMWDADFQLRPGQWEANQHTQSVERWQKARDRAKSGQPNKGQSVEIKVSSNPKFQEILDTLSQSISSLTPTDALNILDKSMTILGVDH